MKIVGNCPSCGNPIYDRRKSAGMAVRDPLRTCFCPPLHQQQLVPTITPPPYISPVPWQSPSIAPTTWPPGGQTICSSPGTFTSGTVTYTPTPKPPDEDAGMVPK
jgi:hypothetical protein